MKGAEVLKLPGLGHVPMGDDPEATAAKILEVTAPSRSARASGSSGLSARLGLRACAGAPA